MRRWAEEAPVKIRLQWKQIARYGENAPNGENAENGR
jgi:hypothetical protein